MIKNCILFLTNNLSDYQLKFINHIKNKSKGIMDFYVLYDNYANKINKNDYDFNIFEFNSREIKDFLFLNKLVINNYDGIIKEPDNNHKLIYLYNSLIALIEFKKEHKYKHYLLQENDIVYTGDYSEFFKEIDSKDDVDYIHLFNDKPVKHWPYFYIENNENLNIKFAWAQMYYVSDYFLDCLEKFQQKNNTLYMEFLLPTLADKLNVKSEIFNRFMLTTYGTPIRYEKVYLDCVSFNTIPCIIHPIKKLEILNFLQYE